MAVLNAVKREIDLKIVYYGPALCGKTTNVQCIHRKLAPEQRGDIMTLATKDDRTLFFDFLPIELGNVKGFKTRFHIYTVPGQVYYALTRRAVLTGVDGIVFVADSQMDKMEENFESLKDLDENLKYYKKDLNTVPFILQYNKRDLNAISPVEELNEALNTLNVLYFEASAIEGTGVMETLTSCCKLVLKQMNKTAVGQKTEASGLSGDEVEADEPIIKITHEEPSAILERQEPSGETRKIGNSNIAPLSFEEPSIPDSIEPEIKIDSIDDQVASLKLESDEVGESKLTGEGPAIGIQTEPDASLKIIACGQPQKISDIAVKVPIIFKHQQLDRECVVNITMTFDDFKLRG